MEKEVVCVGGVSPVTDSTLAVVSGAQVTVIDASTNEKRAFTTNDAGSYEINNLFPGVYSLEITAAGFTKYRNERIELASNQNVRLDVKLEVSGQVAEITVSGGAGAAIETETAKLSDVRNLQQLQTLPMAARLAKRVIAVTDSQAIGSVARRGRMSQEEYALLVGARRQSVNREFRKWERAGGIRIEYGGIKVLDRTALEELTAANDLAA